eukprot:8564017-Pyramimonas_sp.AAC.1
MPARRHKLADLESRLTPATQVYTVERGVPTAFDPLGPSANTLGKFCITSPFASPPHEVLLLQVDRGRCGDVRKWVYD